MTAYPQAGRSRCCRRGRRRGVERRQRVRTWYAARAELAEGCHGYVQETRALAGRECCSMLLFWSSPQQHPPLMFPPAAPHKRNQRGGSSSGGVHYSVDRPSLHPYIPSTKTSPSHNVCPAPRGAVHRHGSCKPLRRLLAPHVQELLERYVASRASPPIMSIHSSSHKQPAFLHHRAAAAMQWQVV